MGLSMLMGLMGADSTRHLVASGSGNCDCADDAETAGSGSALTLARAGVVLKRNGRSQC
jgi:hypothetical protein